MKLVNGKNYYNKNSFKEMCEELEKGEHIQVYINCIGHTRNNYTQEEYREVLEQHYGENLIVHLNDGYCSYSYDYKLRKGE